MTDFTPASTNKLPFVFDARLSAATLEKLYCPNDIPHAVDIFQYYISSIEQYMRELHEAFTNANFEDAEINAHTLISTFGYVGLTGCQQKARQLQETARKKDQESVVPQLTKLSEEVDATLPIVVTELKRLQEYVGA